VNCSAECFTTMAREMQQKFAKTAKGHLWYVSDGGVSDLGMAWRTPCRKRPVGGSFLCGLRGLLLDSDPWELEARTLSCRFSSSQRASYTSSEWIG